MGMVEFGGQTVRGFSQSAVSSSAKHHPINHGVGVHRSGGGGVTLYEGSEEKS